MIIIDGEAYNGAPDGRIHPLTGKEPVCFAQAAFLPSKLEEKHLAVITSLADLKYRLDSAFAIASNRFYCLRGTAFADHVRFRSMRHFDKPYPQLSVAAQSQAVFERTNYACDFVGFRYPAYMAALNLPGWHIHIIGKDRQTGGHLLDLQSSRFTVKLHVLNLLELQLPTTTTFDCLDTSGYTTQQIERIE